MERFAFIIHPLDPKRDVARKFKVLGRLLPVAWIHFFSRYFPPLYISQIRGVRSAMGGEAEGWLLACPYTPQRMLTLDVEEVYGKIVRTARMGERLGARIVGLGAFTSVVGDAGLTVAKRLGIPVTTGNSYAVVTAIQTLAQAAARLDVPMAGSTLAVVGATGSIGRACARYAARWGVRLLALGRNEERLRALARSFAEQGLPQPDLTTEVTELRRADLVLAAASSDRPIIEPEHLKVGAVVCDVALPPNVSPRVFQERKDVLVVDGGAVRVPGEPELGFDFGLAPGLVYACMAETMLLALEGRYESFTLGREISLAQLETIAELAAKHGFAPAGLFCRGRPIAEADMERIRLARQANRADERHKSEV